MKDYRGDVGSAMDLLWERLSGGNKRIDYGQWLKVMGV
jgi:hypothetical protein